MAVAVGTIALTRHAFKWDGSGSLDNGKTVLNGVMIHQGSLNYPSFSIFLGIKQCKRMVILRNLFLRVHCWGWCHIMTPAQWPEGKKFCRLPRNVGVLYEMETEIIRKMLTFHIIIAFFQNQQALHSTRFKKNTFWGNPISDFFSKAFPLRLFFSWDKHDYSARSTKCR